MATVASRPRPVPETRLRAFAVLTWPRLWPSAAEVADGVWENSHPYDGLASGSIYFLSRDPLVALTQSPYGYVGGNPLNDSDPSGQCGLWGNDTCWGHVGGAIKSAAGAVAHGATQAWNATGGNAVNWVQHNLCFTPGNANCQPLAPTVGVCASAGIYGGIGYSGSVCFVVSGGFQHGGLTFSGGAGVGLGGGVSGGPMVSNAPCINALSGPFAEGGGGAGPFAANGQAGGNGVWAGSGGIGYSTPEGYAGVTRTTVWQWW